MNYIPIVFILLLLGILGIGIYKEHSKSQSDQNKKNKDPKIPKDKPLCKVSEEQCGTKNCCDKNKEETCIQSTTECCPKEATCENDKVCCDYSKKEICFNEKCCSHQNQCKDENGKVIDCCDNPDTICASEKCCDKNKTCLDKSTNQNVCCDKPNTKCIKGNCCTNPCKDKDGNDLCCDEDQICGKNKCWNKDEVTTCYADNKSNIITDYCTKGVEGCVGAQCCDLGDICSYDLSSTKNICCDSKKDFHCITTPLNSKICCYKDNICNDKDGKSTCCKTDETCINGFCCKNEYKCQNDSKCCFTGQGESPLRCVEDQNICCDKNNIYKDAFGNSQCCKGDIYTDKNNITQCCPMGSHKLKDGVCKLVCGDEFCNEDFGEICLSKEQKCVNTNCKWGAISYSPPLVANKYDACSVDGSDEIVSIVSNPKLTTGSLSRSVNPIVANTPICLEGNCIQRLDENGLSFVDYEKGKCSGKFDCKTLPNISSRVVESISKEIKPIYNNAICLSDGKFTGLVCSDKDKFCNWDKENSKFVCNYGFYNNNGKCEKRPSLNTAGDIYNELNECCLKNNFDWQNSSKENCCKKIGGCLEYSDDCSQCTNCGNLKLSANKQKCCSPIPNCKSYAPDCSCADCEKTISNCTAYRSDNCLCKACASPSVLSPNWRKCCPKIGTASWPSSGYCQNYNNDCKCDLCACSDCTPDHVYQTFPPPPWSPNLNKCCNSIQYCTSYDPATCKCKSCVQNNENIGSYYVDSTGTKCCINNRWTGKPMCVS
jgi:hypothetical protein